MSKPKWKSVVFVELILLLRAQFRKWSIHWNRSIIPSSTPLEGSYMTTKGMSEDHFCCIRVCLLSLILLSYHYTVHFCKYIEFLTNNLHATLFRKCRSLLRYLHNVTVRISFIFACARIQNKDMTSVHLRLIADDTECDAVDICGSFQKCILSNNNTTAVLCNPMQSACYLECGPNGECVQSVDTTYCR